MAESSIRETVYLQISTLKTDGGQLIGRDPRTVARDDLVRLRDHDGHPVPQSPIRAIRAKCLDCCCQQVDEVRKCTAVQCALWPFRMMKNPFDARAVREEPEGG